MSSTSATSSNNAPPILTVEKLAFHLVVRPLTGGLLAIKFTQFSFATGAILSGLTVPLYLITSIACDLLNQDRNLKAYASNVLSNIGAVVLSNYLFRIIDWPELPASTGMSLVIGAILISALVVNYITPPKKDAQVSIAIRDGKIIELKV